MGKFASFWSEIAVITGFLSILSLAINTAVVGTDVSQDNEMHKSNTSVNIVPEVEATLEELTRFLKAGDLVQDKDTLLPILVTSLGTNEKYIECNDMNNSVCLVQNGHEVVYLSVIITKENLFTSHLRNPSSLEYKQLSRALEQKIDSIVRQDFSLPSLISAKVMQFRKGSIIADLRLEFADKDEHQKVRKKREAGGQTSQSSEILTHFHSPHASTTPLSHNSTSSSTSTKFKISTTAILAAVSPSNAITQSSSEYGLTTHSTTSPIRRSSSPILSSEYSTNGFLTSIEKTSRKVFTSPPSTAGVQSTGISDEVSTTFESRQIEKTSETKTPKNEPHSTIYSSSVAVLTQTVQNSASLSAHSNSIFTNHSSVYQAFSSLTTLSHPHSTITPAGYSSVYKTPSLTSLPTILQTVGNSVSLTTVLDQFKSMSETTLTGDTTISSDPLLNTSFVNTQAVSRTTSENIGSTFHAVFTSTFRLSVNITTLPTPDTKQAEMTPSLNYSDSVISPSQSHISTTPRPDDSTATKYYASSPVVTCSQCSIVTSIPAGHPQNMTPSSVYASASTINRQQINSTEVLNVKSTTFSSMYINVSSLYGKYTPSMSSNIKSSADTINNQGLNSTEVLRSMTGIPSTSMLLLSPQSTSVNSNRSYLHSTSSFLTRNTIFQTTSLYSSINKASTFNTFVPSPTNPSSSMLHKSFSTGSMNQKMNQTTSTFSRTSIAEVKDFSVSLSYTLPPPSNQTALHTISTSIATLTSLFLEVKNTSTNPSYTPPLPSSTVVTNFSSKSIMKQTASYFSLSLIATSSMFLEVKNTSTNVYYTSPLLSSTVVTNFSSKSSMNQTASYFSSSLIATSSMFLEVKNSSTNPSLTPPLPSSTVVTNFSSKSTMNQTASYFSSGLIATSSMFLEVKNTSTNVYYTSPFLSSAMVTNFSSKSSMNQTASRLSSSLIPTSSMFLEVKNSSTNPSLTPPLQSSTVVTNFSSKPTIKQTATYFSSSLIATSSMFLEIKNSSTNPSLTPPLPSSTVVTNLSSKSIMNQTASPFSSSLIPSSSIFLEFKNSSLTLSYTPTQSTMNDTPTIFKRIVTTSSALSGSIYKNRSTLTQISTSTFTPEIASNNKTIIPTTSLNMINQTFISTVTTTITNSTDMSMTSIVDPSTRSSPYNTSYLLTTQHSSNKTSVHTLLSLTSIASTSIANSSYLGIASSSSSQYNILLSGSTSANITQLLTTAPLYSSSLSKSTVVFVPRNSSSIDRLMYSTISVNTTTAFSTHTELHINQTISSSKSTLAPSFSRTQSLNSSTPTVPLHTMSTSSIPTGMANSSSQASSISTTALSSTHSDNATYSTTVIATERAIQTTQSSNNFSTNSTTTSSLTFSSLIINASTAETKRTNLTSINSTTLQIIRESSTKVIKPTSVVSSVLASSTASTPIASSEKRIIALNVTIVNKVYTSPLANKSSEEYIKLAKEVKDTLELLFRDTPGFLEVVILGFRNGSVIIDSYVRLQQSSNTTATELGMVITANPNTTNLTFTDINVEELCTSGYCSNHGTCKKISKTQLECSCNTDYTGPRCSSKVIVLKPRDDDDDDEFDEYWIAIGVCIGLFVLIVILLIFLALRRRRKYYVTRESVMSIGRTSGDVFFNPAFGHSREYLAGNEESGNVVPLEVVYENSSSSFKKDTYQESEFMSNKEEDEEDIYKTQLLLFLKQNNLLKNSSDDTQKPSWASSRSSLSTAGSDSGL